MAKYFVEDTSLTSVADAIRAKSGTTEVLEFPGGFVSAVEGITAGGGGDTTLEDGLVTRTLTEYTNDRVTEIGTYAFVNNTTIETVSFPNVTDFKGSNNFQSCTKLRSINFPKLQNAGGGNAFRGCTALTEAILPQVKAMPNFRECSALEKVDIGHPNRTGINFAIGAATFYGATVLDTVIIRKTDAIFGLVNISAFTGTPFASGGTGGTVYVPAALIEQYQQATNWSTLYAAGSMTFVAIEGSEYE